MEKVSFTVTEEYEGERLDKVLPKCIEDLSRSYIQKLISEGQILVNDRPVKGSARLKCDDELLVFVPKAKEPEITPEDIPLDILYEDDDVLVVNKPKGMVVHPSAGHYSGTLVNALLFHCHDSLSGINGILRPGIVHRIDQDTTGSLIVCKNDFAHASLARQLKDHSLTRRYEAIVHGVLKEETGTINAPIGRDPNNRKRMAINAPNGKEAITHYRVLQHFKEYTHIECRLETGRTHQIRVHMTSIGHPLLGDMVYGVRKNPFSNLHGQTLHAKVLGFVHPRSRAYVECVAPLPEYFEKLLHTMG